ncbi:regulator of telomere elongation helicase 1 homolog isoform X1 [Dioscorea cayenensis subsp. rotundata]|uniref:Regulator of telomere elongation helicase 1 homolog n=1 Tax=Dioscorea cayennensis subsp. rotundata TaxID=55577 RepID=A0AB40ARD4_DIOCR|nr:regulator of telomere elongation helicase 1 homolog isoform X1 [Dioscorea cayenensis subsp. rotundata]
MPIYKIRGIDVEFPFEAYDCQIVYMEKVIQSLQENCNALLESPTGTGKTLCLLCASLAWRRSLGEFSTTVSEEKGCSSESQRSGSQSMERPRSHLPVIVYTSRTHSQLKQVIRELKASNYRPKMAVLGSREQMCIHDEVHLLRGRAQNNACHYLCKKRRCQHHNRVSDYMKNHPELGNEPFDIEDLVNIGRTKRVCPYYVSRDLHKMVDILFAPYNYLIDPGNRRSLTGIDWRNTVLIFDEAHNLESICADAASFELPTGYLTACISEAKQCVDLCIRKREIYQSADKESDPDNYAILKALLLKLEKRIYEVPITSKELGFTRPGHYIYEFLEELNITYETASMLILTIDDATTLLEEGNTGENVTAKETKGTVCRLESIRDILNIIFRDGGKSHAKYYRFHVQESLPSISDSSKGKMSRTLNWWCFNPGLAMEEFVRMGVRSIILTSGTLSPLDTFALELNLEFPVRLENPHVISPSQIWVGVVPSGPSSYTFNSSYRNRDSLDYKQELGNAIVNFARIVPDGLLVFFPSYYLMDQCLDCWKNMNHASSTDFKTIWERICKNKKPVIEPKQSALFQHAIEDFEAKLRDRSNSGAIFFAVCRGKVSEGLDFADHAGRAVVITGMPFSMKTDPKIRLKRDYLDQHALSQKGHSKVLTGEEWYVQQATRAVNQAVGRVIRHRHDYGAIIFCDERFTRQSHQCQMSYWLRPYVQCYNKFGDVAFGLTKFFRDKVSSSLVKPKTTDRISAFNAVEITESSDDDLICVSDQPKLQTEVQDKVTLPLDKLLLPKLPHSLTSTVDHSSRKPLSSVLALSRGSTHCQTDKFVPANRSHLSCKKDLMSGQTKEQAFNENRPEVGHVKYLCKQDSEMVALSNDLPCQLRSGDAAPVSFKKAKLSETGVDATRYEDDASLKSLYKTNLSSLPQNSCVGSASIHSKPILKLPSCRPAEVGTYDKERKTLHAQAGSSGISNVEIVGKHSSDKSNKESCTSAPCGREDARGAAFLVQVQQKLSVEEYTEFVDLMKALKSKTMKVMPVLESIARLFSAPGRFFLLERFKDFVPPKYRPLYEQHIRSNCAADAK